MRNHVQLFCLFYSISIFSMDVYLVPKESGSDQLARILGNSELNALTTYNRGKTNIQLAQNTRNDLPLHTIARDQLLKKAQEIITQYLDAIFCFSKATQKGYFKGQESAEQAYTELCCFQGEIIGITSSQDTGPQNGKDLIAALCLDQKYQKMMDDLTVSRQKYNEVKTQLLNTKYKIENGNNLERVRIALEQENAAFESLAYAQNEVEKFRIQQHTVIPSYIAHLTHAITTYRALTTINFPGARKRIENALPFFSPTLWTISPRLIQQLNNAHEQALQPPPVTVEVTPVLPIIATATSQESERALSIRTKSAPCVKSESQSRSPRKIKTASLENVTTDEQYSKLQNILRITSLSLLGNRRNEYQGLQESPSPVESPIAAAAVAATSRNNPFVGQLSNLSSEDISKVTSEEKIPEKDAFF